MTNAHMVNSEENLRPQKTVLENPFPNKYHFDEFAGFEGERRLKSILRKILPLSLHRTWEVFEMAQAQGNDCYLGLVKASDDAERAQKTIRQDILEFQARKLLVLRHEVKVLRQLDGTYRRKHVLVKDFTSLYHLAHEYYYWTRSDDYIAADRDFVGLILADEHLVKKLRRFNNYRRILMTQIPGPKPIEREEHRWYAEFEEKQVTPHYNAEDAEGNTIDEIHPKYFPEYFPEQFPEHSVDRITSKDQNEPPKGDSDSSDSVATTKGTAWGDSTQTYSHIVRGAIRSAETDAEDTKKTNDVESNRTSNLAVTEKEMAGAERAKEVGRASDSKKLTSFERTALKAGVSIELVDEMQGWYQACLRPQKHPMFVQGMISTCSQELGNMANLQSNLTQATKLFRYAQLKGFTEDDFRVWLYDAAKRACREGITNKMAYFFTALKIELLVALVGSQWPPQPPELGENEDGEEEELESVDQTEPQDAVEASQEEPQDNVNEEAGGIVSPSLEVSDASVRETEQEAVSAEPLIFCDDPTSGWPTYETACWWADRLRDTLGAHIYTYSIRATEHGKWAFVFFVGNDISRGEIFLTGSAVSYCLHHGWQPPQVGLVGV